MATLSSNSTFYYVRVLYKRPGLSPASIVQPEEFFGYSAATVRPHNWGVELVDAEDSGRVFWWPWPEIVSVNIESTYS